MDDANLIVMVLKQRPALPIADGYAHVWQGPGQDIEKNINEPRKPRPGC